MEEVTFRKAVREDVPLILEFIKGLAEYEKMSDEVVATEEILDEWLFDKEKAEVIFAIAEGEEVGFALFFHNFSTFLGRAGIYLEDLFVKPKYRGNGYGKAILKRLAQIAVERGCGRLEWSCLDWNQPSIDFYLSLGATPMKMCIRDSSMGIFGAAFATGLSPVISIAILLLHFKGRNQGFHLMRCKLEIRRLGRIMALGFSSLIGELASAISLLTFNLIILGISGNIGVAAYGIIANIALVATAVFTGCLLYTSRCV